MPAALARGCELPNAEAMLSAWLSTLKRDLRGKRSFFSEDGTLSCLYAGFPVAGLPSCGSVQNGGLTLLLNRACRPQSVVLGLGRVPDVNSKWRGQ